MNNRRYLTYLLIAFILTNCSHPNNDSRETAETPVATRVNANTILYKVLDTIPHDTIAFTEGLEYYDGKLYESTGKYGETSIRQIDPKDGKIISKVENKNKELFGEGITHFNKKLYQLTYQSHEVLIYNQDDLQHPISKLHWPKEGWGLTHDDTSLIVSDGSTRLYYVKPETFSVIKTLEVNRNGEEMDKLNELEFIDGFIYANRWYDDKIYKIDPKTGNIIGEMHFEGLLEHFSPRFQKNEEDVLNGIAWNEKAKLMYVTGKNWPVIFTIQLD
ncbi:glutaminyl-peptide cyclotransferase [Olivibacter domesticus]|uniref:Glutamine cyclotransferase n=1 Tax=Olivibacter domesticus TaxID=407022 RepID=A0A1H7QL08_OLID1|nr:glutaminyl-peptide cyclotransferase [Olivibacter domesticus]SEL48606.1 Glutamine cyclotransferase [Olivibacter domesticus]